MAQTVTQPPPAVAGPALLHSRSRLRAVPLLVCAASMVVAALIGAALGPVWIAPDRIVVWLVDQLPWVNLAPDDPLTPVEQVILTKVRLPRVVLGALVGALLAGCGATFQGVFRNPLADPYLLGAASGAGLGAVIAITLGLGGAATVPVFAFAGSLGAVTLTYLIGSRQRSGSATTSLVLAGVAVAAFLGAAQSFLLQQHSDQLQEVYAWMMGRLVVAGWTQVLVAIPYAVVTGVVLIAGRRTLDVLAVGDDEARTLGLDPRRARIVLVLAATLGTAAAVSMAGLIGFVGLVVPHVVRLLWGGSFRVIVPLAILLGATVLVLADVIARMAMAPAEIPIGVVTAFLGAPFFAMLLARGRT